VLKHAQSQRAYPQRTIVAPQVLAGQPDLPHVDMAAVLYFNLRYENNGSILREWLLFQVSAGAINRLLFQVGAGAINRLLFQVSAGAINRLLFQVSAGAINRLLFQVGAGAINRLLFQVSAGAISRLLFQVSPPPPANCKQGA
jgi:hypothetical protein